MPFRNSEMRTHFVMIFWLKLCLLFLTYDLIAFLKEMFLFLLYRDDTKSHFSFCFMFLHALHVTQAFYKTIYIGVCMRCVCMFYIRFTKVYSLEGYCFEPLYYFLSTSYNFSSLVYLVVFVFFNINSHCSISMVRLIGSSTRA